MSDEKESGAQRKGLGGIRAISEDLSKEIPEYANAARVEAKAEAFCQTVRSKLRAERNARGLDQQHLADRLDLSQSAVSKIEAAEGDLGLKTLYRYAAALGLEPTVQFAHRDQHHSDDRGASQGTSQTEPAQTEPAAVFSGRFFKTQIGKMFSGFSFADLDVEAIMRTQQKNLEAFTQANQLAVQGFQELAKQQTEFADTAMDEASALVRDLVEKRAPEEKLKKHVVFAVQARERSSRQLVEIATKVQADTFDILKKRFTESLEEWGSLAAKDKSREARH
jgi:phasin family protein